ncbi:hsp90 co-chaperone Cdc37 [Tulasnella sp. 427]|nr:hsp90 co-chaperone Cdc37 [Tulasnella sp. 427]
MARLSASAKLKARTAKRKVLSPVKSKAAVKAKTLPTPVVEEDDSGSSESEEDSGSEEDSELEEEEDEIDQEGMKRLMDMLEDGEGLDDIAKEQLEALDAQEDSDEGEEDTGDDDDDESQAEGESEEEDEEESGSQEDAGGDDVDNLVDEQDEAKDDKPRANPKAMKRMRELIQLDPSLPWTETLVTTWPETHASIDPSDDLNREISFYKQALHCAKEAKALASKHSLPFTRPNDYFAEMVKSDIHMERVRSKLLDEAAAMKRSEEAKRQRDLKKYGKQIQVEKIKERAKNKKEMLEKVSSLKRKRAGGMDELRDDDFDIALDETLNDDDRPPPAKRGRGKGPEGKSRMSRKARDSKYHWGSGQAAGKHGKSNNRETLDDFDYSRSRGGRGPASKGKGKGGSRAAPKKRLEHPISRFPTYLYSTMPLNYSKWDALELSDDSDIEGHPNVDHKSLVRWKQRDIHERREARKRRIAEYKTILALNEVLIPRVKSIMKDVGEGGPSKYSAIVEQLTTAPSDAKPAGSGPNQPSYDTILGNMLIKIKDDLKTKGVNSPDTIQLTEAIQGHLDKIVEKDNETKEALQEEEEEQKKKITSDDIHEGFSSTGLATHDPEPEPKKKAKAKAEPEIEVLNPGVKMKELAPETSPSDAAEADDEEEEDDENERVPDLSPTLLQFSKISVGDFESSYRFIQAHTKDFRREGIYDELVIAGFRAAIRGDKNYAKQCIHQALIIQYCDKLGKDGVSLFFKRMLSGDPRSRQVFDGDFKETFKMMLARAENAKKEDEAKERIQLVAEDSSSTITFNVPDGPPPETIKLEGPGTEGLDVEEVRKALQARWDIYESFPAPLKKALKTGKLDAVNDVLGDMEVTEAEEVVKFLEIAGILSFSKSGIVDETGKNDAGAAEGEAAAEEGASGSSAAAATAAAE